jgi:ribose transport system ATP-binding protein
MGVDSEIIIMDCPTRGVDIGVKAAMYKLIYDMKKSGKSILLISEELPELIGMSDRILIMRDGKISAEIKRNEGLNEHKLINAML